MTNYSGILGSDTIAKFIYFPERVEQNSEDALRSSAGGIFIGNSFTFSMPFFLEFESLINPHVFVLGMSGGGKTFLVKNLILKMHVVMESTLVVIDFTGEYAEEMKFTRSREVNTKDLLDSLEEGNRILYLNLKDEVEQKRIKIAGTVLKVLVKMMRSKSLESEHRVFVILDEAWKLLKNNKDLEIIIREGRKYRVGLILASQLVEDVELPFLANSATFFVFRVQNKKSLERLSKNYGLSEKIIFAIQNLEVGSCLVIQVLKSKEREVFFIKRVIGISNRSCIRVIFGDMVIEIDEEELCAVVRRLCDKNPSELISEISLNRSIELHTLISRMLLLGTDRRALLTTMRALGIEDYEISDAFAFAIEEIGVVHERELYD